MTPEQERKQWTAAVVGGPVTRTIDRFIELVSPATALRRIEARSRAAFIRTAARSDRLRKAPDPLRGPEHPREQKDTVLIMQRARELVQNSGFFSTIASRFADYVIGSLRYIPQTGSEATNQGIKDFVTDWETQCDATGRFHFVDLMQMMVRNAVVDGDHGILDIFDPDAMEYRIQPIEADRIGNPYLIQTNERLIRGVHIEDETPVAFDIYHRSLSNSYQLEATVPAHQFHHYFRARRPDQYRGTSLFESVVGLYEDVRTVREAEIMALKWASSKAGVVRLTNPPLPGQLGGLDRDGLVDGDPSKRIEALSPGEIAYLQRGEDITIVEHNRPNPNLMAFLESLLHEAALAADLPYSFIYQLTGLTGTPTRLVAQLATRTFRGWQYHAQRHVLDRIIRRAILTGIANGRIPWTENWWRGKWIFPSHPSVDIGRESAANLAENRQALKSAATIYAEQNADWREEHSQIAEEAANIIEHAKRVASQTGVDFSIALNLIQQTGSNPLQAAPQATEESPATDT